MILHDYQCSNCHHTFEKMVSAEDRRIRCPFCRSTAERVFLPSRKRLGNAMPTVYYVNRAGKKLYPWTGDRLPKGYTKLGYERIDVQSHEIRSFERQVNREMQRENQPSEAELRRNEEYQKYRHDSLRQDMAHMDAFHRDIAREAMKAENEGYSRNYDPEFHVGAYS